MNELRILKTERGMFSDLHPSDPLYLIMACYDSALDFMYEDVPDTLEVLSAMYDLYAPMSNEYGDLDRLTVIEIEAILKENGFDFISMIKIRENPSQNYLGGEIIGL